MTEEIRRWDRFFRLIRHLIEFIGVLAAFAIFRILPIDTASAAGGALGRSFGPLLPASKRGRQNLSSAFPEKSAKDIEAIVRGVWDNFGRTAAEYPHLAKLRCYGAEGRVELHGEDVLKRIEESAEPHLFFSGHFANLEVEGTAITGRNMPLMIVYRAANNPFVNWLLLAVRKHGIGAEFAPKGTTAARELIAALGRGSHAGLLVDQKMNDGIAVPFFGRDAMTAPALAQLALKSDRPIVPLQIERLSGARFRITVHPPLEIERTGDRETDVYNIMVQVNATLEDWIRQHPDQWFWLHNRWSD